MSKNGWTEKWYDAHLKKSVRPSSAAPITSADPAVPVAPTGPAKKPKYRSTSVYVDNIRFASILEADRYCELKLEMRAGTVLWFERQMAFHLPGGVTYRCDFFVTYPGSAPDQVYFVVEDTKGYDKQEAINKRKQVAELKGIKVKMLYRADVGRYVNSHGAYVHGCSAVAPHAGPHER